MVGAHEWLVSQVSAVCAGAGAGLCCECCEFCSLVVPQWLHAAQDQHKSS